MNSPEKEADRILGILLVEDAEKFLLDSVNLPNPIDFPPYRSQFDRWFKCWKRMFTFESESADGKWQTIQIPRNQLELFAPVVRTTLCRLWVEQNARQRDWYFYRLRDAHREMVRHSEDWPENTMWGGADTARRLTDYVLQDVPKVSPFEAAIYWLQCNQKLMLRCPSELPLCTAPYFFRKEKGQKFCSPECADPARREAKLRWWNESPNSPKNKAKKKQKSLR